MHVFEEKRQPVKRLGELLLESGFISEAELTRAVDSSRKNFQSLGKVLVLTKTCSEAEINNALEIQKYCKLEGLSGSLAVRTLQLIKAHYFDVKEALYRIGWLSENYNPHDEPEEILQLRKELAELKERGSLRQAQLVEALGDVFAASNLPARAEVKYEEALDIYDRCSEPGAAFAFADLLGKMGKLAIEQSRFEDAKQLLSQARTLLEESGHRDSREYGKWMHLNADFLISQRNFSSAEQQYIDCFAMLEEVCGLEDPLVLETVRKYVEIVNKGKPNASRAAAAAKWREMSHESHPDKVTLGELLKGARLIEEKGLTSAWQFSKDSRIPLGRAFVELGLISEKQLQQTLKAQLLVRNGEVTAQLGVWILLYAQKLNLSIEEVLELFSCAPRTVSPLADELRAASEKMQELEASLPPNHPELGFGHAKQAKFYFYRQQYSEAAHHYKRALEILKSSPDLPVESLIELLDNYAQVTLAMEEIAETLKLNKMAVQLRSKHFGKDSIPYAKGVEKLAQCFCLAEDHHTALSLLEKAQSIIEALHSRQDREIVSCLELKADCLVHSDDLPAAEECLEQCLAASEHNFGKQHTVSDRIRKKLAETCKSQGKTEKARSLAPNQLKKNTLFLRREPN